MTGLYIILGSMAVLAAIYLFMIAPSMKKNPQVEQLGVTVFAHRGLHDRKRGIPENSLAAYRRAVEHGVGIELDVHVTADRSLVIMHDDTVKRMTGAEGTVNQMRGEDFADLRLDGTEEHVPFLDDALELVNGRVPLLIELKADGNNAGLLCPAVFERLDRYEGPYIIESFDPRVLRWVRKNRPQVGRGQLATKEGPTPLIRFVLRNLLANVISRPHFIAYQHEYSGKYPGPVLCRCLFRCVYYEWTIREAETLQKNRKKEISSIFEGFLP